MLLKKDKILNFSFFLSDLWFVLKRQTDDTGRVFLLCEFDLPYEIAARVLLSKSFYALVEKGEIKPLKDKRLLVLYSIFEMCNSWLIEKSATLYDELADCEAARKPRVHN